MKAFSFFILLLILSANGLQAQNYLSYYPKKGKVMDKKDVDTIIIETNFEKVTGKINHTQGAELWAILYNSHKQKINKFDLNNIEFIELTGADDFMILLKTKKGANIEWSCVFRAGGPEVFKKE